MSSAAFPEPGQEDFAPMDEFLGGDAFEQLFLVVGTAGGDSFQVSLFDGNQQNQVAAHELGRAIDDLGAHGGFGEVGEPEHEATTRLKMIERHRGAQVVGLAGLTVDERSDSIIWRRWVRPRAGASTCWVSRP